MRHVCCETAVDGGPVEPLFPDRDAYADFFTRYYTDFEPETAFVAERVGEGGEIVAYLIGCTRPRRHTWVQLWLLLFVTGPKVLWRLVTGRYGGCGRRFLGWFLLRAWRETPAHPPAAAHFHFNALPGHRNTGAVLRLWRAFDALLAERGVDRVYGQIRTGAGDGGTWRGEKLFGRWGFTCFDRRRVTKLDGLVDREVHVATYLRTAETAP